jgi:hypothetical protein
VQTPQVLFAHDASFAHVPQLRAASQLSVVSPHRLSQKPGRRVHTTSVSTSSGFTSSGGLAS